MFAVAGLIVCIPAFGVEINSCKILDPDFAQGNYQGSCKAGFADGYGEVEVHSKSDVVSSYHGDFLAGKKHGKGIKVMPNGDRYEGDFRDDYREGHGIYVWGNKSPWSGDRYEGDYVRDKRQGFGVYQWNTGDRYEGEWKNDQRLGLSVMEQRRAQAAKAAASAVKPGAVLCAEEKWDGVNTQLIRGKIESVVGNTVRVRVNEVEGGVARYRGVTLVTGVLLMDEARHWQYCDQN